jgi:hypothetical protein
MLIAALILGLPIHPSPVSAIPFMNVAHISPLATPMKTVDPLTTWPPNYCNMSADDFPPPPVLCTYQTDYQCYNDCANLYTLAITLNIVVACQSLNAAYAERDDCYDDAYWAYVGCFALCPPLWSPCYSRCAIAHINAEHACDTAFVSTVDAIGVTFAAANAAAYADAQACMASCCIQN